MGEVEEIENGTDRSDQIKGDMQCFMVVGPLDAQGGAGRAGGKVPMKVIAADGGKEDEPQQVDGRGDAEQQSAGLPDHHHSTYSNIEAAEDDEIDDLSQHDVFRLWCWCKPTIGKGRRSEAKKRCRWSAWCRRFEQRT